MSGLTRTLAGAAAAASWIGLAVQIALILQTMGVAPGLWRFFGYFTILTNFGVAVVATAIALAVKSSISGPRSRLMATASILLVGIVYSLALRALWNPRGWQKLADFLLHDAAPLLWFGLWLSAPHVRLDWREIGWSLVPPALYVAYALARGAADGWYAYWFLDPSRLSAGQLALSIAVMLAGFGLLATALVALDRRLGRASSR